MSATKGQHRGHCQVCGRIQVVLPNGAVAKHGYTVPNGYFRGICQGSEYGRMPLEIDRVVTDAIIKAMLESAARNEVFAIAMRAGELKPERVMVDTQRDPKTGERVHVYVPWNVAPLFRKREQVEREAGEAESNARFARAHATDMTALAARVHGQPLIDRSVEELAAEIKRAAKSAPIAGAYRTKVEQKRALEQLSRKYSELTRDIKDTYLEKRDTLGEQVYWGLPHELHQWRTKHSLLVLEAYPEHSPQVDAIEVLVINRNEIKARPVIK